MICGICLENIYFFSYKSKCGCNLNYHNDCIIEWYKHNKVCPICKEVDNIKIKDINKSKNNFIQKIAEFLLMLASIIVILILNFTDMLKYINLHHIILIQVVSFCIIFIID